MDDIILCFVEAEVVLVSIVGGGRPDSRCGESQAADLGGVIIIDNSTSLLTW